MKEQCNRYDRIDLADETKSLMRVIQSAGQIAHELEEDAAAAVSARRKSMPVRPMFPD